MKTCPHCGGRHVAPVIERSERGRPETHIGCLSCYMRGPAYHWRDGGPTFGQARERAEEAWDALERRET